MTQVLDEGLSLDQGVAASPATTAVWVDESGNLTFTDAGDESTLADLQPPFDHGTQLTGQGDDDHTQYLNTARHGITGEHIAGLNITLPISGDVGAKTTLGAHVGDTSTHWFRPAQSLIVAQGATGQYATIAAALAVANANADSATPYEVAIHPGIYAESNLTVGDFVSLRSVVPWQAQIAGNTANPILIIEGESVLDGILISNLGAGDGIEFTSAGTGNVYLDHVSVTTSGVALDFNATNQDVTIDNGSRIQSSADALLSGKTAVCRIVARNTEFNYGGASAPAAIIEIANSKATTAGPDLFDSCQFYADNLIGGVTPAAVIDWDAETLWLRNCAFNLGVNTAKQLSAIFCQSGTVELQSCKFDWVLTSGTDYDFNAASGATINFASCVYDVARTTGAGTIAPLSEGEALFDTVTMAGALVINAADAPLVHLRPSSTGDNDVFTIAPTAALAGANTWRGAHIIGDALTPAAAGASIFGAVIDLSGIGQGENPVLCGALIEMPAVATTTADFHALKMTGNGQELIFLNKDFAIDFTATSGGVLLATFSDSATNTIENSAVFKHLTDADMIDGFGASWCFHIEDDASGDQTIAIVSAERRGADNVGTLRLSAGTNGAVNFVTLDGSTLSTNLNQALSKATGLHFGGNGVFSIFEDGTGGVWDDAGQDSLFVADTIQIKLGDAAGVERISILDSASAEQAYINSNGQAFFAKLSHPTDTNTSILFNNADGMIFDAGGIEFLRLIEGATDEFVINEDGVDLDFRVEALGTTRALVIDGADGQITMSQTLTVGDGVADKILGVTDGTNTAMMGYDGVPHIVITGDSTFIVYSDDTDSDSNFIVRGNGTGTARSRAQTSGGDWIGINHDGVRGTIDSSLGGIRMSDDTEFAGEISYTSTGGMQTAGVSVAGNAAATAIAGIGTFVQFTEFDTNDPSFGLTADQANDQVIGGQVGIYHALCSITVDSVSPTAQTFAFELRTNSGATTIPNTPTQRIVAGGGAEPGSVTLQGNVALPINEDVTVWIANLSTTGNILLVNCTLTLDLKAGN